MGCVPVGVVPTAALLYRSVRCLHSYVNRVWIPEKVDKKNFKF